LNLRKHNSRSNASLARSMLCGQGANTGDELVQKLIGLHEHCEVSTAMNRNKGLQRCLHGLLVFSRKHRRSRKVFVSLEDKHGDREFEAEFLWSLRLELGDKMLAAKQLALSESLKSWMV
jgi:hypothetical protein